MSSRKAKSPANKAKSSGNKDSNAALRELFQGVIPTSPRQQVLQEAARQGGWTPRWEHEDQTPKKKKAGKRSGVSRGGRAEMRLSILALARNKLLGKHLREPYSTASFAALRAVYDDLLTKNVDDPDPVISGMLSALSPVDRKFLKATSDDTLVKDLQVLLRRSRGKR